MSDFLKATAECDIVMKGGITSGVVYPLTVAEIARKYRLKNIGGASAGALAAAITAAAEHDRQHNHSGAGFDKIKKIPKTVAEELFGFFQPVHVMKPAFNALLALQDNKLGKWSKRVHVSRALLVGYWPWTLVGLVPGLVLGWFAHFGSAELLLVLLTCLSGILVSLGYRLSLLFSQDMPANNFGLCTGMTMPGTGQKGLTDWLADTIDDVAGRPIEGDPLTFKDLWGCDSKNPDIRLDMMTTNLSMYRAHRLPFRTANIYKFRKSEFKRLFPKRIVDYMVRAGKPVMVDGQPWKDYYDLPERAELPVVVAARMSLSFPGLIQAVPLYTCDRTLKDPEKQLELRRCLFSDGGLTSNFPIHFFDRFLPTAPTFAVALEEWRPDQHGKDSKDKPRAYLPPCVDRPASAEGENIDLPVYEIKTFSKFLMSLIDSAKGWQDTLQSTLPGYSERIVHIPLDYTKEGGLNLKMSERTIKKLVKYGEEAGKKVADDFDFDDHRWLRFLVAVKRVEETLEQMLEAYGDGRPGSFRHFLDDYSSKPKRYEQKPDWLNTACHRFDALMVLAKEWSTAPLFRDGRIPDPESDLRITARY